MAHGGYSSVGRALPLQGSCQEFESPYLHHINLMIDLLEKENGLEGIPWYPKAKKDVSTSEMLRGAGRKL